MARPEVPELPHGSAEVLVRMANDIGDFFRAETVREEAVAGIANHICKFWTLRMRQRLLSHGEAGLDELPRDAMRQVAEHHVLISTEPPGGDAG
jgi:formate dehydrogenase subunit delta